MTDAVGPNATPPAVDPALRLAIEQRDWLITRSGWARQAETATFVLLVVLGAATTLAAALDQPPALTATLAALGVVVTGLRARFQWHQLSVGRLEAAYQLTERIQLWTLDQNGTGSEIVRKHYREVNAILEAERRRWMAHRSTPDPTTR